MDYLLPRLQDRSFARGSTILAKGSLSDGLYVIASGLVGVSISEVPGVEHDIASLGSGECVGEMSLMNGEPCSATIHALVDTRTWFIARDDFPDVLDRCPTLWRNLSGILSRRLVRTNRRLGQARQARFAALYLLTQAPTAASLAFVLGASLAGQTRRKVLLLDMRSGRSPAILEARRVASATMSQGAATLGLFDVDPSLGAEGLQLASLEVDAGASSAASDEIHLADQLKNSFDEVILVCDAATARETRPWLTHAGSTVIVADQSKLRDALSIASTARSRGGHRVDLALLTDMNVTSENAVGGLWEPSVLGLRRAISSQIAEAGADVSLRLIPRDLGILARAGENGLGVVTAAPTEPFNQAISRLARRLGGVEIGLALGAGMAKGFAHLGVLKVFKEEGVPIDYIAGSSIGAIVGSTFAGGMPLSQLDELMTGADRRFVRPTLPIRSISSNRGLKKILTGCHERAPTAEFAELFIPFAAVATDVTSGREVVLRDGTVWSSVLASISMPGIFPPVVYNDRVLVDGGLVNPVPGKTVREMGADIVIGVDLASSDQSNEATPDGKARVPNIIEMLWRTMEIMLGEITSRSAASADVTIRPNTGHSHIRDFSHRGLEFIATGERAALAALPEIASLLPSVKVAPEL